MRDFWRILPMMCRLQAARSRKGSLAQADNDKFMEILRTPNILPLLTSPEICKRVGFWDAKKASREIKEILNQGLDNPEQEQVDAPEQMTEER